MEKLHEPMRAEQCLREPRAESPNNFIAQGTALGLVCERWGCPVRAKVYVYSILLPL